MPETQTPTTAPAEASAPVQVTDIASMTPEERVEWKVSGKYPERKPEAAQEPPKEAAVAPEQEADSAQPDDTISEAARTLRKNRSEERKKRIQSEIDDLTRKRHEAARELELIEARRKALEASPSQTDQPSTPADPAAVGEPDINDFADFKDYQRAFAKWLRDEWKREQQTEQEARTRSEAERQQAARLAANQKRVEEARKEFSDWDAVVSNPELPVIPREVIEALIESPLGPRLSYRLALDRERMTRMSEMTPAAALLELGKLAAELEAGKKPAPKTFTQAPPPPTTLGSQPTSPVDAVYAASVEDDFTRYKAEMNAKQRAAGRNW